MSEPATPALIQEPLQLPSTPSAPQSPEPAPSPTPIVSPTQPEELSGEVKDDPAPAVQRTRGWNTITLQVEPYGRDFKVLDKQVEFGLDPEAVIKDWNTSWKRDPAADHGGLRIPTSEHDGELAFSIVLQREGKPTCTVVHRAFVPGIFSSAGVFDAEARIHAVFKDTILRALFDQLNAHLKKAFPDAPRRRPRREELSPAAALELMDENPPGE
jgi:hypothetical protein